MGSEHDRTVLVAANPAPGRALTAATSVTITLCTRHPPGPAPEDPRCQRSPWQIAAWLGEPRKGAAGGARRCHLRLTYI